MYIDLLDSVKTGHPAEFAMEKWWRPKDEKDQVQAISISHAAILIRLLYGDTITLSHHQILDSCGWLTACSSLIGRSKELPFPPVRWAAYKLKNPKPGDFVCKAIEVFLPGADDFKLSAWPGLEPQQKQRISDEIKRTGSFKTMLRPVLSSLESSLLIKYQQQQEALVKFHEYLTTPYTWSEQQPLITPCHEDNPISLWGGMESRRNKPDGIPGEYLEEIKEVITKADQDIEKRSNLYNAITKYEPGIRMKFRKIIDYYYNLKISYSTDKGAGLRSILDQNAETKIKDDLKLLQDMDSSQVPNQQEVYTFVPEQFSELATLDFEDFIRVMKEPNLRASIQILRTFKAIRPKKNDPEYVKWKMALDKATDEHEKLLAKELKGKVHLKGENIGVLVSTAVFGFGIPVAFHGLVNFMDIGVNEPVIDRIASGVGGLFGSAAQGIIKKIDQDKIRTSAVARIHNKISKSVKRNT